MTGSTADRRRFLRLIRRSCAAALDVIALTHALKVEKAAIAGFDGRGQHRGRQRWRCGLMATLGGCGHQPSRI